MNFKIPVTALMLVALFTGSLFSATLSKGSVELNEYIESLQGKEELIPAIIVIKDRVDCNTLYQSVK